MVINLCMEKMCGLSVAEAGQVGAVLAFLTGAPCLLSNTSGVREGVQKDVREGFAACDILLV